MPAPFVTESTRKIKASLREWSWESWLVDAGLTLAISTVVSWVFAMPWYVIFLLIVGIGASATGFIEMYRRNGQEGARQIADRLVRAKDGIRAMAQQIPSNSAIGRVLAAANLDLVTGPRDWRAETTAALRATVRDEVILDYEKCLPSEEAAREFLVALAENITSSDLRGQYRANSTAPLPITPGPQQ